MCVWCVWCVKVCEIKTAQISHHVQRIRSSHMEQVSVVLVPLRSVPSTWNGMGTEQLAGGQYWMVYLLS